MTSYDRRTFLRTSAMAVALCALTFGVMISTDGAMTTTSEKLGRLAVLSPILGAIAALLSNAQARARGEMRALAAIGTHPTRACAGALFAMAVFGSCGAVWLLVGFGDLGGLFPRPDGPTWIATDHGWSLRGGDILVDSSGAPGFTQRLASTSSWSSPRIAVGATIGLTTIVLVDWVRRELGAWQRLWAAVGTGGVAILLFTSSLLSACRGGG